MRIRYFIPLALAILVLFAVAAQKTGIVPPFSILAPAFVGMILLLFQLEDHKVGKVLAELGHAFREAAHHHK